MSRALARLAGAESPNRYDGRSRPSLTPLRKVLAVGGAVVFLATFYLRVAARAGLGGRVLIGAVFGGVLLAAAALGSAAPPRADAHLTSTFDAASVSGSISPIQTGWGITQPIVIRFSARMAATSVQAALRISPQAEVKLDWDASGSQLYVEPLVGWEAGTVYTVTVGPGAKAADGTVLAPMPPATVYVRPPASAVLAPTHTLGDRLGLDSGFRLTFSRPVDLASLRDAFTMSPAADGTFAFEGATGAMPDVIWVPSGTLKADTVYTISLSSAAVDLDGAPVTEPASLKLRTIARPEVVRFRPRNKEGAIDPGQTLSVRFSEAMARNATRAAYHLYALDKAGKRSEVDLSGANVFWSEGNTVMAIHPAKRLVNGTRYIAEIASSARSVLGVTLSDDPDNVPTASFSVVPKATVASANPAPKAPTPTPTPTPTPAPKPSGGGTSTAPWLAVEKYYLTLLNCDHTGGWIQSDGSCVGYGSNGNAPLVLDPTLSTCASRPWAKYLATTDQLYHGDFAGRMSACGYGGKYGAENLTSTTYDVYYGAIHSMLFFQSEKSYLGGHWVNLLNSRYTHAGIGVWRYNGRAVYTVDFWGN